VREFMERRGVLTWLTSLFNRSVEEDVVREVVEELRRRGLLESAKKALNRADVALLEPVKGCRFLDHLSKHDIGFDDHLLWLGREPVAYVGEEIVPVKDRKGELRKALEVAAGLRRKLGLLREEDPIYKALQRIESLEELDPLGKVEQYRREKDFRQAALTLKLLDELGETQVERAGFLKHRVTLNPGYEDFFYNRLSDYTREEIYKALKNLEKKLHGKNKVKIRALRKEFEKREGISRRKKLGLLALAIAAGMAAGRYV